MLLRLLWKTVQPPNQAILFVKLCKINIIQKSIFPEMHRQSGKNRIVSVILDVIRYIILISDYAIIKCLCFGCSRFQVSQDIEADVSGSQNSQI